jgi:hypothetical protein
VAVVVADSLVVMVVARVVAVLALQVVKEPTELLIQVVVAVEVVKLVLQVIHHLVDKAVQAVLVL